MLARMALVHVRLLLLVALVAALPASVAAREIDLRWVAGGGTPAAGYLAYLRTDEGSFQGGVDLGLPALDEEGVFHAQLDGVPDEDVYLALTAYSTDGFESSLSNELFFPLGPPTPGPDAVTITVTDGAANPILDGSCGGVDALAGVDVAYSVAMDGRGRLSGSGAADLDGDGSFETPIRVRGKVKGSAQEIASKLKIQLRGSQGGGKTRLRSVERHAIDSLRGSDEGSVETRGKVAGTPVQEERILSDAVDTLALGWTFFFEIDESAASPKKPATGSLVYGEDRSVPLEGTARFAEADGTWKVRMRSSGEHKGLRMTLDELALSSARDVLGGRLRYKAFGQKGELELPSGL